MISDINYFAILHRLNEIMTCVTGNETPEGDDKLIFRKEKDVRLRACIGMAVIDPENSLNYQSQIVTNHVLHIEKIAFFHFPRFPEGLAIMNVFLIQLRKIPQVFS